jgi:hypothetical protein
MNNILLSMTRFLRDRGIDAELFLFDDEAPHFHPSADSFDLSYQSYTTQLAWGDSLQIAKVRGADIARTFARFDRIIGCGTAPAYLHKAARALDLFVPYGGDVFELPFRPQSLSRLKLRASAEAIIRQRRGIVAAKAVVVDGSLAYERALDRLNVRSERIRLALPFPHTLTYAPSTIGAHYAQSHWYGALHALRQRSDVMVFHHARHIWGDAYGPAQAKGNDKLIHGFKRAQVARPDVKYTLVMCEYGPEVARSRALVRSLGLEQSVLWLPQTVRKELMVGLSLADIGCGEFSVSWLSGGTIYETLASGKPLLHYRDDALYARDFPDLYPLMNANTAEQIAAHLVAYADRPDAHRAMGEAGRRWHQTHAIEQPIDAIVQRLKLAR